MARYVLRRLLQSLLVLWCIVTFTFFLARFVKGGPFDMERRISDEAKKQLVQKYGMDKPIYEQYLRYLARLATGDLDVSTKYLDVPVARIIGENIGYSLLLGSLALLVAVLGGIPLGLAAARKPGGGLDRILRHAALVLVSLPGIIVGPLLILCFALWLGWLPAGLWSGPQHLVMPVLTLALPFLARIQMLTREKAAVVLASEFVRAARARGLSERRVFYTHALKNSLVPVVAYLAPATAALLTGSVVVESIFVLPGIGKYFVQAALNRDTALLIGVIVVYSGLLVLLNLAADLLVGWLDPRARAGQREDA